MVISHVWSSNDWSSIPGNTAPMSGNNIIQFSPRRKGGYGKQVALVVMAALVGAGASAALQLERPEASIAESYGGKLISMPICGGSARYNCVVDGDTIWLKGEKIRLETFNTPEFGGKCRREINLASRAQRRLSQLLSKNAFTAERSGHDRFGRRLATIKIGGRDVGAILIAEGVAHRWNGYRQHWC